MLELVTNRTSKPKVKVIKIAVTEDADTVIENFAADHSMLKQGVASRIYERFGQLPREVQLWFIGITTGRESAGMRKFAEDVLGAAEEKPRKKQDNPHMKDLAVVD